MAHVRAAHGARDAQPSEYLPRFADPASAPVEAVGVGAKLALCLNRIGALMPELRRDLSAPPPVPPNEVNS